MRDSVDSYGQTTVMVTHEPRAAAIADRILFLADGQIVSDVRARRQAEILETLNEIAAHDEVRAQGPAGPQAAHGADRARDRARRRDDQRHVRAHGLDRLRPSTRSSRTCAKGSSVVVSGKVGLRPHRRQRRDGAGVRRERPRRRSRGGRRRRERRGQRRQRVDDPDRPRRQGDRHGGAPNLGFAIAEGDSPFNPLTLVEGEWPGPNEVVIDKARAERRGLRDRRHDRRPGGGPGRVLQSPASSGSRRRLDRRRDARRLRPADGAAASSRRRGKLDEIAVAAEPGTSDAQLIGDIAAVLPPGTQVRSRPGAGRGRRGRHERVHHLPPGLPARLRRDRALRRQLRDRELALDHDRPAGARVRHGAHARRLAPAGARRRSSSRRSSSVRLASVVGLFLGLGLAKLLFWLFDAVGFTLPNSGLLFETRTIVVSLPRRDPRHAAREPAARPSARRACRRSPPCARGRRCPSRASPASARLGSLAADRARLRRARLRALRQRPRDDADPPLDGRRRAVDLHRRRALLRPARPAAGDRARRAGGAARRRRGALARDNARRNPQRTASTAAALMIGLALVTLVATLAAGITSTFRGAVDEIFTSDYAITAQNNFSPIPIDAAEAAAEAPGVEAIASTRTGEARVFDTTEFITAVEPDLGQVIRLDWVEGSQDDLRRARRERRDRRRRLRRDPRPQRRLADRDPGAVRRAARARGERHLRAAGRRLPVRRRHLLERDVRRSSRVAAKPLHVRPDARRRRRSRTRRRSRPSLGRASRTRRRRRGTSSSTTRSPRSTRS